MTKIGFIGQGWIGRNLADHFEERGFDTVRYAKEPEFEANKDAIAKCDIVFIAVPTPTNPSGFDPGIIRRVVPLVGKGKIAVIKSTILPGTTDGIAEENPGVFVLHSPEFLRETSVRHDIDYPDRNIVGIPTRFFEDEEWQSKATEVMKVLPKSPYRSICKAPEAELTKYGGNNFLYTKVLFMNLLHDLSLQHGARWEVIAENMKADPRIGTSHMQPVHQYSHMGAHQGRGAGGHCFIKDFAALRSQFEELLPENKEVHALLRAMESLNNRYLRETSKDLDLLEGVYGERAICICRIHDDSAECECRFSAGTR
jgi:nucleotide sugar dehydrogenase